MQQLLRWLASWQDLAVDPDSKLHLEFAGFPSGGMGLLVLLGLAVALLVVILTYRRDAHRLTPVRRFTLAGLRLLAILLAFATLLEPRVVAVKRDVQPGHVLMVIDTSQSMEHRDTYALPEVSAIAGDWRSLGVADVASTSRNELVKQLLSHDDQALLQSLRKNNRVLVYGFSNGLEPLAILEPLSAGEDSQQADPESTGSSTPSEIDLETLIADGSYTNIEGAVRKALERSREANVAGFILLSDGRRNLGGQGPEVARLLRSRKVPHAIVLPIGDPSPVRRLQISRVDAPDKVFQKDPFTIRAAIESQGYEDQTVTVRLKRQSSTSGEQTATAETLQTEQVRVGADRPEAVVEFADLRPAVAGVFTYVVEIDPPEFEPQSPERHLQRKQIEVLGEQTQVLLIAGGPTHEYRILRNLLTRDKTIELACWLLSADDGFVHDGNTALEEFPSEREDLEKFDVVLLMDPDSSKLDASFCELLAKLVTEDGVGLSWICGEKYTLEAMREGKSTAALVDLLPVVVDLQEADETMELGRGMARAYSYQLTSDGRKHKATRIEDDRAANAGLWSRLPGLHFAFPVLRPKPGALVLATHSKPTRREPNGDKPMLAVHFLGAGRVMFSATDDVFRWRHLFEDAYDRYWVKGIRFLFEGRLNAGNSRLRLTLGEEKVELGQPVKVTVDAKTASADPLVAVEFPLTLRDDEGREDQVKLAPVEGLPGQFETYLRPTKTGYFQVAPAEQAPGRPVQASFQVVPAAIEKEGPADVAELAAIADVPGGQLLSRPTELAPAFASIESASRIETFRNSEGIWDSWITIALLLTVLALEWWLRKKSNLL